ncbi:lipid II:glycine glycyltransferase FemX [Arcanobacterium hippocoleae]|uniref:lipid II:glycine glycyltransferase FemX n=1 Tax=Arcanobacterium hippocoleae TaxID=149017 RepID=UPI003340E75C
MLPWASGRYYGFHALARAFSEAHKLLATKDVFLLRADPEVLYRAELNDALQNHGFTMRNRGIDPHSTSQPRVNMRISMEGMNAQQLLDFFQAKTRYNIRLAARKGVQVRWSQELADVDQFFETYRIMSERHGITHRPLSYFHGLAKALGDHLRVYLASYEDEILSAAICVNYGDVTWYMYGGSTNSHRNKMPNYLMQWEMIQWAIEQRSKYYDFGGVYVLNDEDGLFRFKRGFVGAENISEYIGEIDYVIDQEAYEKFIAR